MRINSRIRMSHAAICRAAMLNLSILVALGQLACLREIGFRVRDITVEDNFTLHPSGPHLSSEPSSGSYYFFLHGDNLTMADHFLRPTPAEPPQEVMYLEMDEQYRLSRTVKRVLLSSGPFGAIYSEKTCFYNKRLQHYNNTISVYADSLSQAHEVPTTLRELPSDAPRLTSFSLVKIYVSNDGYIIAAANYDSSGSVVGLQISRMKNGRRIFAEDYSHIDKTNPHLAHYAIPNEIDIRRYSDRHRLPTEPGEKTEVACFVYRHYGFNRLLQEDTLKGTTISSSRVLRPSLTKEEIALNPSCEHDLDLKAVETFRHAN